MKIRTVYQARSDFAALIDGAQAEIMVVTRYGKPVAAVVGIDAEALDGALSGGEESLRRRLATLLAAGRARLGQHRSRGR